MAQSGYELRLIKTAFQNYSWMNAWTDEEEWQRKKASDIPGSTLALFLANLHAFSIHSAPPNGNYQRCHSPTIINQNGCKCTARQIMHGLFTCTYEEVSIHLEILPALTVATSSGGYNAQVFLLTRSRTLKKIWCTVSRGCMHRQNLGFDLFRQHTCILGGLQWVHTSYAQLAGSWYTQL